MIVVDASLAVKWLLNEPDSETARAFLHRRRPDICGPDLLAIEVCRSIVTAANARRIDQFQARTLVMGWLTAVQAGELPLHTLGTGLIAQATEISLDLGHPLADCLYLALALDLDAELVTCDAKFAAKARTAYPMIKLLADYGD